MSDFLSPLLGIQLDTLKLSGIASVVSSVAAAIISFVWLWMTQYKRGYKQAESRSNYLSSHKSVMINGIKIKSEDIPDEIIDFLIEIQKKN